MFRQLAFTLLDLIQLGDIVPHMDSITNVAAPNRHEVHEHGGVLLHGTFNSFEDMYNEMLDK